MKSIKKIIPAVFAITLLVLVSACGNHPANEINPDNKAVANLAIDGMTCEMGCAKTIEEKVAEMNGVAGCNVDFEGKTATVEYDKSKVSEEEIVKTISALNDGQYTATVK